LDGVFRGDGRSEELHRFLQNCVRRSWRDIYLLRGYFCAHDYPFHYSPYADQVEFQHEEREEYFEQIPEELCRSAVILVDPDNGLVVPSARRGNLHKFVKYEEVRNLLTRMDDSSVLSVYQHLPRIKRGLYFNQVHRELESVCGSASPVSITDNRVAFILLAKTKERAGRVRDLLQRYARRRPKLEIYG